MAVLNFGGLYIYLTKRYLFWKYLEKKNLELALFCWLFLLFGKTHTVLILIVQVTQKCVLRIALSMLQWKRFEHLNDDVKHNGNQVEIQCRILLQTKILCFTIELCRCCITINNFLLYYESPFSCLNWHIYIISKLKRRTGLYFKKLIKI